MEKADTMKRSKQRFPREYQCKEMLIINYHNITYPDMNNGDGLRVVLWLSGCSHRCFKCQNPQTWDVNSGILFDKKAKEELFRELENDYISGLTLSGGDPLNEANLDGVLEIVTEFNDRYKTLNSKKISKSNLLCGNKTIWLYTGFTWEQIMSPVAVADYDPKQDEALQKRRMIVSKCDVLVDGRYIHSERDLSLKYRGSKNQRVINIEESINENVLAYKCE